MQQAIEEAKKMIKEYRSKIDFSKPNIGSNVWWSERIIALEELIERLEKLPQEQTIDDLFNEMPYWTELVYMTTYYVARTVYLSAHGNTPIEALCALKEKLSTKN